jgi:IgGFc binding protein
VARILLLVLPVALGCGGTQNSGYGGSDAGKKDATDDASARPDATVLPDASGEAAGALVCSEDLHSVLDTNGNLVQLCISTEGCANGRCVPACEAAAAARGTLGCDFVLATPSFDPNSSGTPCFAIVMANAWGRSATIQLERAGTSYDAAADTLIVVNGEDSTAWTRLSSSGLPSGSVGILSLASGGYGTCFYGPAVMNGGPGAAVFTGNAAATGVGEAFHIVTSMPVSAYDFMGHRYSEFFGGSGNALTSAELVLPTSAWGKNSLGIVAPRGSVDADVVGNPQWGQIVAAADGTKITVVPSVSLPSGASVEASPASKATTFTLNAGQFLQWQDSADMTGSILASTTPFAFAGGSVLALYSSETTPAMYAAQGSSLHQQIPPISTLGYDFVAAPYRSRFASLEPESIPYRLVAAVDGTKFTYDPAVPGAPDVLNAGQPSDFETTLAFHVTSQDAAHPFVVEQLMSVCVENDLPTNGCYTSGTCCLGSSEWVAFPSPAQFLSSYLIYAEVSFATTNLVLTRVRGATGFEDVTLDCAGTLSGWQPVGTSGKYEVTNVDLIRGGVSNGTCVNGTHTVSSRAPFGLVVWGLDDTSAYVYPAGLRGTPSNSVVVPPIPK